MAQHIYCIAVKSVSGGWHSTVLGLPSTSPLSTPRAMTSVTASLSSTIAQHLSPDFQSEPKTAPSVIVLIVMTSFTLGALDFAALHNGVLSADLDEESLLAAASIGESVAQPRSAWRADQGYTGRAKATMHQLHGASAKRALPRSPNY